MNAIFRKNRTRAKIFGTAERPRLCVTISNKHISVQLIDDVAQKTLASASSVGKKLTGTMTEKCAKIGTEIGKAAKKANIKKIVFDRGANLYAGRMSALADAARKEGLEF